MSNIGRISQNANFVSIQRGPSSSAAVEVRLQSSSPQAGGAAPYTGFSCLGAQDASSSSFSWQDSQPLPPLAAPRGYPFRQSPQEVVAARPLVVPRLFSPLEQELEANLRDKAF